MKRFLCMALSVMLILSTAGCGGKEANPYIISSSGTLLLESSAPQEDFNQPEQPDPEEESALPPSQPPVSSSSAVASKPPASSSSAASSKPPVSSSVVSSKPPVSSSSTPVAPSSTAPSSSEEEEELPPSSSKPVSSSRPTSSAPLDTDAPEEEVRAVWISYLDFNTLLKNKTKTQFVKNINQAFGKIEAAGFNTVIVQVRPYGDALYKSTSFPWSHTITGTEGKDPGFDPLAIMVEYARDYHLSIDAWINPYRIRNKNTKADMDEDSVAYSWLEEGTGDVIEYDGGIYFNPGSEFARRLIVEGVEEIVENYAVDGIHFDDYFYPTTDADFDAETYAAYKADGGKLSLANWRRENVNLLVQEVYEAVKSIDRGVRFGISPQGNNDNNYNSQYCDVKKWVTKKGYVDYICPQVYFGFNNENYPYAETVEEWNDMISVSTVDLWVGLAPYKLGTTDQWAGSGKNEWVGTTNILARMVAQARDNKEYQGFALFRYDSLFNPASDVSGQVKKELSNLSAILD